MEKTGKGEDKKSHRRWKVDLSGRRRSRQRKIKRECKKKEKMRMTRRGKNEMICEEEEDAEVQDNLEDT